MMGEGGGGGGVLLQTFMGRHEEGIFNYQMQPFMMMFCI